MHGRSVFLYMTIFRIIWKIFFFLILTGFIIAGTLLFVAGFVRISGSSMQPTYLTGSLCLSNKLIYRISAPQRGDVVEYFFPSEDFQSTPPIGKVLGLYNGMSWIGRIIGLPGEQFDIVNGSIAINHMTLSEPYLAQGKVSTVHGKFLSHTSLPLTLPSDSYMILVDSRTGYDSEEFGLIPKSNIVSRIEYCSK